MIQLLTPEETERLAQARTELEALSEKRKEIIKREAFSADRSRRIAEVDAEIAALTSSVEELVVVEEVQKLIQQKGGDYIKIFTIMYPRLREYTSNNLESFVEELNSVRHTLEPLTNFAADVEAEVRFKRYRSGGGPSASPAAVARDVRRHYERDTDAPMPIPVPVDDVARWLGCEVWELWSEDPSEPMPDFSGQLRVEDDHAEIEVRGTDHRSRKRFAIAHELGHLLLHAERRAWYDHVFAMKDRCEREANQFAAEFLMPADEVGKAVRRYGAKIATLSRIFDVSPAAMRWRLINLGFLR